MASNVSNAAKVNSPDHAAPSYSSTTAQDHEIAAAIAGQDQASNLQSDNNGAPSGETCSHSIAFHNLVKATKDQAKALGEQVKASNEYAKALDKYARALDEREKALKVREMTVAQLEKLFAKQEEAVSSAGTDGEGDGSETVGEGINREGYTEERSMWRE